MTTCQSDVEVAKDLCAQEVPDRTASDGRDSHRKTDMGCGKRIASFGNDETSE